MHTPANSSGGGAGGLPLLWCGLAGQKGVPLRLADLLCAEHGHGYKSGKNLRKAGPQRLPFTSGFLKILSILGQAAWPFRRVTAAERAVAS
ncbi:hypothetical protein TSOC_003801 [Tetrabaena socialis]|uniref:Uncharacterized protein n=1 Tax=Tetrabaena socialis TaxID=47790 RepID=A0A2J8AAK5_9CHLO|nr:hypothetical protein TSOC_003801 [Tetrabaena socialis]|eukprot:PNH09545.1 hypothetical protein TSOC_003801 [Tetrabaena socialis]